MSVRTDYNGGIASVRRSHQTIVKKTSLASVPSLKSDVEAPLAGEGEGEAPVTALEEAGSAPSFTSHVPEINATGKSQLPVNTIPWPTVHRISVRFQMSRFAVPRT